MRCLARLAVGLAAIALARDAAAATGCEPAVATVVTWEGTVEARRAGQAAWTPVARGEGFCPGDAVRVLERSRAALLLAGDAVLRLDEQTTVTFVGPRDEQATWIELLRGVAHFLSRLPRGLRVFTPFVNGTVEGTEFWLEVTTDRAVLAVLEGEVAADNPAGRLTLRSGEAAMARAGQGPAPYLILRPRDAVQWALHFPTVVDYRPEDFPDIAGEAWPAAVRRSVEAYRRRDATAAFAALAPVPADAGDPRVFTYRATLLLSVGRVDAARADIDRALALRPSHADALALLSILAVVRNDRDEALRIGRQAAGADAGSAAARVALSYAQQASLDLEGARASLEAAARLRPQDALVQARLAEIWLALGRVSRAREAALRAVDLDAGLAQAHAVLGFAELASLEPRRAGAAFTRAIDLDPSHPLARLGSGLARIRRGDLDAGRREIEIAASLDPGHALIRSYLGKAYYEERRDRPAAEEFAAAKTLDPGDPTPWFYDAVRKQSVNRPVEALEDLEQAIRLNDNRAVYRSRLLLDEDLAARTAGLARIYADLGFDRLALVEGTKSVDTDPTIAAGHRFLADAYAALPRHEIARVSEVLQAQLLQPLTPNPVPPRLSAAGLFIPEGTGPANPAFNEFDALFLRDGVRLEASGVAGNNGTAGDEATVSGLWRRLSFSLGQFHYETDGFRPNNDLTQDIYNVFAQARLSPATSVQTELRYRETRHGDLLLRFDPDNFLRDLRQTEHVRSARVGARHALTPDSDLLASVIYGSADFGTRVGDLASFDDDEEGVTAEAQYLGRFRPLGVVTGAGYFESRLTGETEVSALGLFERTETSPRHVNAYLYSHVIPTRTITATVGVSADFFDEGAVERDQVNPKAGVVWTPWAGTAVRAAFFRTLKRRLVTNQTIEPTHVAGFNQFFDDVNGTDAKRYGVGLDQKLLASLFIGAEAVRRLAEIPFTNLATGEIDHARWDEDLARAYLYWTPATWLALSAEYRYERLDRDELLDEGIARAETHRVPLTASVFHRSGLRARVTATPVHQRGSFADASGAVLPGEDDFLVLDASIGYRLPRRWGLVTVEGRNLLDERFRFEDTDPTRPEIYPERLVVVRLTVAF